MLAFSAADFEDFLEPRPDLAPAMEADLEGVVRHLAEHRWPFRLHATYDESITRFLDVFERVNRDVPFDRPALVLRPRRDDLAAEHRTGQGARRRHRRPAPHGVPGRVLRRPLRRARRPSRRRRSAGCSTMGVPVGAGTDATRVASYNPWVALSWLVTGRTVGGLALYPQANRLDRATALRLMTRGSAWMSREDDVKGRIAVGQYADLAVLSADYFRRSGRRDPRHHVGAHRGGWARRVRRRAVRGSRPRAAHADARLVAGQYAGRSRSTPPPRFGRCRRAVTLMTARPGPRRPGRREPHSLWGAMGCGCWAY